jgi:hypothetical protein
MASTAHDLLTPLTGLNLSLSLAKKSSNIKEIRDLINTSLHCTEMMGMIVNRSMALFGSDAPAPAPFPVPGQAAAPLSIHGVKRGSDDNLTEAGKGGGGGRRHRSSRL